MNNTVYGRNAIASLLPKRILISLLLLTLLLPYAISANGAEIADNAVNPAEIPLNAIVSFSADNENATVDQWISSTLSAAPSLNEWYALGIAKAYPSADLTPYADALSAYLSSNEVYSATTAQKYGIALIASGDTDNEYLQELVDNTAGKQGIMSYVFALHLLTNGAPSENFTVESIIPVLLRLACEGGGWSLTGTAPDVDVTAMTIQALAPYYALNEEVKTAVDAGITALSAMQRDSGGFISYGVENPESAAQVIIALLSVGRDPLTDASFTKNGSTPFSAMMSFALADGSFSHTANGDFSASATSQVFMALSAMTADDSKSFFTFGDPIVELSAFDYSVADKLFNGDSSEKDENTEDTENGKNEENKENNAQESEGLGYKLPVCIGIIVVAVGICAVLLIKKQGAPSNLILVGIVAALLCSAVLFINVSTPDEYYGDTVTKPDPIGSVTLSILCDSNLVESENAVILQEITVQIEEGETVYDVLLQATKANSIPLSTIGGGVGGGIYVRGIAGICEFDHGDLSGWTYSVNGEKLSAAADKITLKDGDTILWLYSDSLYQ